MTTVLVVEDEPDIRLLCRTILSGAGHQVYEADTAEAGLALLAEVAVDFVLLDIRLPGRAGWTVLDQVRGGGRLGGVRVVVCSAHFGPLEEYRAWDDGAYAFLAKPFNPRDLLDLIEAPDGRNEIASA